MKYLITIVVMDRRIFFSEKEYCELFLKRLEMSKEVYKFSLYAFSIMFDHVHLLLETTDKLKLSKIVQYIKRHSSRDINNFLKLKFLKNSAIGQSRLSVSIKNDISMGMLNEVSFDYLKVAKEDFDIYKFKWQKSYNKKVILNKTYFLNAERYINNNHIKHELDFFKSYKWSGLNKEFHYLIDE